MKHSLLFNSAFLLPFCLTLAFVCAQLNTGLEIFQLISGQKVCHYLGGDKGGRGSRQTVTNGDKGEGGLKIGILTVTYFLNGPLFTYDFLVSFQAHNIVRYIGLPSTRDDRRKDA